MKRILYLIAAFVTVSTTAIATTNTSEANASIANFVRGYGNSFIFVEDGIEFSVFPDGQFDFYAQNFGPNINVGLHNRDFSFSFNTGYNYNPYVQYDGYGAVIQIENTPVFYDGYGRVAQIGNIVINYNGYGRVARIGGLNLFWRGSSFSHYTGFINPYNNCYVYRPWHRLYRVPARNLCIINTRAYRQFYSPTRYVYYRPYRNNTRYVNVTGRRSNRYGVSYAQTPRNQSERSLGRRVKERHSAIARGRSTRVESTTRSNRNTTGIATRDSRRSNRVVTPTRRSNTVNSGRSKTYKNDGVRSLTRSTNRSTDRISNKNVTKNRNRVSNIVKRDNRTSVKSSRSTRVSTPRPQVKTRSTVKNKRSSSIKNTRSSKSNTRSNGISTRRRS